MITKVTYKGPLVSDTGISGEQKADGYIPAHGSGALRVSQNRWMLFFATLDPKGWDAVRSIIWQMRDGGPDGTVVKEGILASCESGWEPPGCGMPLRKIYGMPMAFGVPKGAVDNDFTVLPNANHFVVKCYRHGLPEKDGAILSRDQFKDLWPDGHDVKKSILRVEWMQFRLNDTEDDIEIIQPLQELRQNGYEDGESFCGIKGAEYMNHSMTPAVAANASGTSWCTVDTFASVNKGASRTHGQVAGVEFRWNKTEQRYDWVASSPLVGLPDIVMGETSISRWDDDWVIALRTWSKGGATAWYRTNDLLSGKWGEPSWHSTTWGPRHSYRCADGILRIFQNDQKLSPYGHKRNPLYSFDVNPKTFEYSEPRTLFDARDVLPFETPFCDMSKLCSPQGNKQLLTFRAIDDTQTTDRNAPSAVAEAEWLKAAGIHAVELEYDEVENDLWDFLTD